MNNKQLASRLTHRFTGSLNPLTNIITSRDILQLTKEEKEFIDAILTDDCYVNVNEKTAPQVLSRVFECLYNKNASIMDLTNIKITNLDNLINSLQLIYVQASVLPSPSNPPSISVTPSPSPSPSRTPSATPTPSITPTISVSVTPSITITPSPSPSSNRCSLYIFYSATGAAGGVNYTGCDGTSYTGAILGNGETFCVQESTSPTTTNPTDYVVELTPIVRC